MNKEKAKLAMKNAIEILDSHIDDFAGGFPASASVNNIYPKIDNVEWTSGFYTGMLWIAYKFTKNEKYRSLAEEHIVSFRNRIDNKIEVEHHDMGFLYYLSCVEGYKITGCEYAKETAILAADNLKSRFREKGQFIQAWGKLDAEDNYRLIIDCLLNLPLLFWATEVTGDKSYEDVAKRHLKTTIDVIIRDDYSTYHTYYFDLKTGEPHHGATHQGYRDDSCWSRGQSWAVYGLMQNYAYTNDKSLIEPWKCVTDYFIAHLPADLVAYWDFYFTDGDEPRDSSASAIAVCGILDAEKMNVCSSEYSKIAYDMLDSLVDNYAVKSPSNDVNGILLHSTYAKLLGGGIDECCIWGDFYYMEALEKVINN